MIHKNYRWFLSGQWKTPYEKTRVLQEAENVIKRHLQERGISSRVKIRPGKRMNTVTVVTASADYNETRDALK